ASAPPAARPRTGHRSAEPRLPARCRRGGRSRLTVIRTHRLPVSRRPRTQSSRPIGAPLAVTNLSAVEQVAAETESALRAGPVAPRGGLPGRDPVTPPGDGGPAPGLIAAHLAGAGFEGELLGPERGRRNLLARLRGEVDGPTLCLLGHVDTVTANPDDWGFDP